jgi:hypothetical protein
MPRPDSSHSGKEAARPPCARPWQEITIAPMDLAGLRRQIDRVGDTLLDEVWKRDAFAELTAALVPTGFRWALSVNSSVSRGDREVRLEGVLLDVPGDTRAAQICRTFDAAGLVVVHEYLRIEDAFRGGGLSHRMLRQGFDVYRQLDMRLVVVHAALETGRWHWARMGFQCATDEEQALVETWARLSLAALRAPDLPDRFDLRALAVLGTEESGQSASLRQVREAVLRLVAALGDVPAIQAMLDEYERRTLKLEKDRWGWDSEERLKAVAAGNGVAFDEEIPLGKAIMLAGPDWFGVFDLRSSASRIVFQEEFERRFGTGP